ncbi:MAG: hypothetical protein KI793_21305, partial [Rivularia sp. (in: Bacteria)]|nr:hypothetical protein [Rivularia sp. MS3]
TLITNSPGKPTSALGVFVCKISILKQIYTVLSGSYQLNTVHVIGRCTLITNSPGKPTSKLGVFVCKISTPKQIYTVLSGSYQLNTVHVIGRCTLITVSPGKPTSKLGDFCMQNIYTQTNLYSFIRKVTVQTST